MSIHEEFAAKHREAVEGVATANSLAAFERYTEAAGRLRGEFFAALKAEYLPDVPLSARQACTLTEFFGGNWDKYYAETESKYVVLADLARGLYFATPPDEGES